MPSLRHQFLAAVVPRLRKSGDLEDVEVERARIERRHAEQDRSLPTMVVPFFARRFTVVQEDLGFPSYTITRRGRAARRTVVWVHGGGFVAGIDPFHVRYAARLASRLGARVVLPDYPLTPEHTWRDSHDALVTLVRRHLDAGEDVVLGGDSAGGNIALAVALALRDAGGVQPSKLLLIAPWVDLTESTPDTAVVTEGDPWLFIGKMRAYAEWWAGSAADLARPEVSPALADLAGLPPALMFFGTRDTLMPGGRLLVRRAELAGWPLTYVEEPGLLHVYPVLPVIPEARRAWRQTREFLA